jgi:hypothetical protein
MMLLARLPGTFCFRPDTIRCDLGDAQTFPSVRLDLFQMVEAAARHSPARSPCSAARLVRRAQYDFVDPLAVHNHDLERVPLPLNLFARPGNAAEQRQDEATYALELLPLL